MEVLECIAGSSTPYSGKWIAPSGNDITQESGDLFDVLSDPGHLTISMAPGSTFTSDHNGVYTCLMPDESGVQRMVYIGLYSADYQSKAITARGIMIDTFRFSGDHLTGENYWPRSTDKLPVQHHRCPSP